jgi:hypothetical protein
VFPPCYAGREKGGGKTGREKGGGKTGEEKEVRRVTNYAKDAFNKVFDIFKTFPFIPYFNLYIRNLHFYI